MNIRKKIGVLGGMGSAATAELFQRIIQYTPAEADSDHAEIIIYNDPQIPDRTKYILGYGASPIPRLINNIKKLHKIGTDIIIIPCMTAHSFIDDLQRNSPIPIINAMKLLNDYLEARDSTATNVGLLATEGSIKTGVFQKYITKNIITPVDKDQRKLMDIIYGSNGIKAGNLTDINIESLREIIIQMKNMREFDVVIAGCTELSLIMNEENMGLPVIDPIDLLAVESVKLGSNIKVVEYD